MVFATRVKSHFRLEAEEVIILELVTLTDCSISYLVPKKSSVFHGFAQQSPEHTPCRIPHGGPFFICDKT